ncbi:type IX secretion system protein PorD [Mucilaginibacter arboris]|uniref:DUF4835 family protein n=1 Tax=Mucilaginibacter arboris TaxID=2682090 RepID=A0A7K1T1B2_9SPHI|nr:DUF4835 family protein [Mucilaginibacter arboris]MVN23301.1 DUF4835 family protein [Mucilaginibacter arboris]
MKLKALLFLLFFSSAFAQAQDLNARVQVLSPKIQTTNRRIFTALETAIKDFLNGRKWSADQIAPAERIDCNFVINITQWDGASALSAEVQVQSSRPIFGSNYNSTLLNINDKDFDFNYTEGQVMDFNDQLFQSNLSSFFAFYAYIIVGLDYDSFSKRGGSPYFEHAQSIVNAAQTSAYKGWKAFDSNHNRYWLAENLSNNAYNNLRDFSYTYHRLGLDVMASNADQGLKAITAALPSIADIDRQRTGAFLPQVFFTAKSDELLQVLSKATPQEREQAYQTLSTVDPANGTKYQALQKN